jgi:uncharacterized protein YidB (DUF937 family)
VASGGIGDAIKLLRDGTRGRGDAGGLGSLLEQLQRTGFGEQADSWVSRRTNKPIAPDAMTQIFGHDDLEQISPDGEVPDADALGNSVDNFARRFGLS